MTDLWHWFVIIATVGSLLGAIVLLIVNRKVSGKETTGHDWDGIRELDNPLPVWWVGMFVVSVLFAGGYLLYFPGLGNFAGVGGWTSAGQVNEEQLRHDARFSPLYDRLATMDEDALHQDRTARQVGRRLFLNNCATCHGVAALGSLGFPDLTDDEWLWGRSFDEVKDTLLNGRQAAMTPWAAVIGDEGISNVTQYVRKISSQGHDAELALAGEAQFKTYCVACHGLDGKGNRLLGAPDLTNDIWLYGGDSAQIAATIRHGRNGIMPAFKDILTDEKLHVLAGYVTSLGRTSSD